jgi:hypothetical protein
VNALRRILPRRTNLRLLLRRPGVFARRYLWLILMLFTAATADAITTYRNARAYGSEIELHPVQRLVQATLGPEVGVPLAKLIQLAFVIVVAAWWRPWTRWLLGICAALYALAALSNHFHWL